MTLVRAEGLGERTSMASRMRASRRSKRDRRERCGIDQRRRGRTREDGCGDSRVTRIGRRDGDGGAVMEGRGETGTGIEMRAGGVAARGSARCCNADTWSTKVCRVSKMALICVSTELRRASTLWQRSLNSARAATSVEPTSSTWVCKPAMDLTKSDSGAGALEQPARAASASEASRDAVVVIGSGVTSEATTLVILREELRRSDQRRRD
ncbi:hypothetical protein C8R45DRAFT_1008538 [Mycena sanguinolenta]|nr:hypothetical protein C8R45DRAFT_1008538 [Mycena sanguinolenta]